MNKAEIIVTKDYFRNASEPEICVEWAEDFLNSDRTIEFEIDDIEGTINNESLFLLGSDEDWEIEMFKDNISNYCAYLAWLKTLKEG